MTIGQRVKQLREQRGWSMGKLAQKAKVDKGIVSRLEAGKTKNPRADKLAALAKALDVTAGDLLGDESTRQPSTPGRRDGTPPSIRDLAEGILSIVDSRPANPNDASSVPRPEVIDVPVLGVVPAGTPLPAFDSAAEFYRLPIDMLVGIRHPYILRISGDSMAPRFQDGDMVLVDPDADLISGRVYVAEYNGEVTIKRAYRTDDSLQLVADNPAYAPIVIRMGEVRLQGRVVKLLIDV